MNTPEVNYSAVAPSVGDASRVTRRVVWVLGLVMLVIVALLVVRFKQSAAIKSSISNKVPVPTVSVTQVGVTTLPTTVNITGTIAARYDMPIGVEGDGGRVSAVLVDAGDRVKRGQVLARLNAAVLEPQVANLQAGLEQAKAEAELATAEYRRAQAVGASGALSAEETERRRSSSVTAAAKVKVAAALLAEAQARLARMDIRAPSDGVILTRTVEVGQSATPGGAPLFRLSEGGEVELRGQVAEQDLPLLKVGQAVNVRLTGVSKVYPGTVRLLGAVIDPQSRLGMVRVALTPDTNLRPGAFARADVTVSNAERTVLPQTAVLTDDVGSYVLIVNPENKLERRAVHVAGIVDGGVTITDGVGRNDKVVASAGAFLQQGEVVNPVVKGASST